MEAKSILNPEQFQATQTSMGLVLQAPAGSGKTSVIIEHVIFILQRDILDFKGRPSIDSIQQYLSGLVICTFTIKASNELSLRLRNKINSLKQLDSKWSIIDQHFHCLTICTIHALLVKILKSGLLLNAPHSFEIQSKMGLDHKILQFFNRWNKNFGCNILLKKKIINDTLNILNDPLHRLIWHQFDFRPQWNQNSFSTLQQALIKANFFPSFFPSIDEPLSGKSLWPEFFKRSYYIEINYSSFLDKLKHFQNLFIDFDRIPSLPKALKDDKQVALWHEAMKNFKAFLKEYKTSIETWIDTPPSGIKNELCHFLEFLESYYFKDSLLSFADLEYLTLDLLEKNESTWREKSLFHYFIVDEFQDTSKIQYRILLKLIQHDHSKLYAVGDPLQAIYGFRGGELQVYFDAKHKANKQLGLSTNYRCGELMVEYFNSIFSPFTRSDSNHLQTTPPWAHKGTIQNGHLYIDPELIHNKFQLDVAESLGIMTFLKSLTSEFPNNTITILYPKLSSSFRLITKLIQENFIFKAQVKIPYAHDAIFVLFQLLLEYLFHKNKKSTLLLISHLFSFKSGDLELLLDDFSFSFETINLSFAFKQFYFSLNKISNISYDILNEILEIIHLFNGQIQSIYTFIEEKKSHKMSIDFEYWPNSLENKPILIQIMSVHQSKGLEFDHVLLAGMNTFSLSLQHEIKVTPSQFKYTTIDNKFQLNEIESPDYISSKLSSKSNALEENTRLFYVACTRAKKSLHFVTLHPSDNREQVLYSKDSWLHFLTQHTNVENITLAKMTECAKVSKIQRSFFQDSAPRFLQRTTHSSPQYGLMTDVSVTHLLTLFLCPRMFYYKEILKLPDLTLAQNNLNEKGISTKERGINIHRFLQEYINQKAIHPQLLAYQSFLEIVDSYKKTHTFLSEYSIKFELFGHMVNAVMDVLLLSTIKIKEIWDFKTGTTQNEMTSTSYLYQVYLYAYGCYHNDIVSKNELLVLKIIYLDQSITTTKTVNFDFIQNELFSHWQNIKNYHTKNLSHCIQCPYTKICN